MITLGSKIRDRVSGVKGVAMGRAEYLYTSPQIQVGIEGTDSNGKPHDSFWLHEAQLEVLEEGSQKPLGFCRD